MRWDDPPPAGVVSTKGRRDRHGYPMCDHAMEQDANGFYEGYVCCHDCFFAALKSAPFEHGCPRCRNAESRCTCGT